MGCLETLNGACEPCAGHTAAKGAKEEYGANANRYNQGVQHLAGLLESESRVPLERTKEGTADPRGIAGSAIGLRLRVAMRAVSAMAWICMQRRSKVSGCGAQYLCTKEALYSIDTPAQHGSWRTLICHVMITNIPCHIHTHQVPTLDHHVLMPVEHLWRVGGVYYNGGFIMF